MSYLLFCAKKCQPSADVICRYPPSYTLHCTEPEFDLWFLAELMVELLSWLSSIISNGCIIAKRCKIGPRLLLITNGKLHTGFQIR